jgi:hypothetical protein
MRSRGRPPLLEIRHDLREVGIRLELRFRAIQVRAQGVVPDLVDLVSIAVQVDDDDFVHAISRAG